MEAEVNSEMAYCYTYLIFLIYFQILTLFLFFCYEVLINFHKYMDAKIDSWRYMRKFITFFCSLPVVCCCCFFFSSCSCCEVECFLVSVWCKRERYVCKLIFNIQSHHFFSVKWLLSLFFHRKLHMSHLRFL